MVNIKAFGKVGLIYGGDSSERDVSLKSGKAVAKALDQLQVDYTLLDGDGKYLIEQINKNKLDRCLIMQHGGQGESGILQGILDDNNIPYTGSRELGCTLAMDKLKSKEIWQKYNILMPRSRQMEYPFDIHGLKFPLAIKPISQGSSIGVSKVLEQSQLEKAFQHALSYGDVIAEEWIEGKECSVPIVNGHILPPVWIKPKRDFYDYEAKNNVNAKTEFYCPSQLPEKIENKLKKIAKDAFERVHCSGWGRVDFIVDNELNPYLMEVNTVPGMTELSLVPRAARVYGWEFDQLVLEILKTSMKELKG